MAREKRSNHGTSGWWWVMAVLVFLVLLLLYIPRWLNPPHSFEGVRQKAQFHSLEAAIGLFKGEFNIYPPSDANDSTGKPYCGAMKLAEAMMGQDILGFHSKSVFRADGKDADGVADLYDPTDLTLRKGPFLPLENANAFTLTQIYGEGKTGPYDTESRVLCDVFRRKIKGRKIRAGMPILYYKADTSKSSHDIDNPDNPDNIFNYRDNHALLALGVPGQPEKKHPLYTDPKLFYRMIKSAKGPPDHKPVNAKTYILISPGYDGLYGTADDICNFEFIFPHERKPDANSFVEGE